MRSVVPSESETVPLPDQAPSKPAKGADCAWPTAVDNINAVPMAAALIACPNNFIWCFPVKIDALSQDTSRRIDGLVSPQCLWFKWWSARGFARPAKYTNRTLLHGVFLTDCVKKASDMRQVRRKPRAGRSALDNWGKKRDKIAL